MALKESLKQAGYVSAKSIGKKQFILTDEDGKQELWTAKKGHANHGIIYKNTHLEFVSSHIPTH